jgi:hypothetical protein
MSDAFPIHSRDGKRGHHEIQTLDDWKEFAPPTSADQWQPRYSALELARAWVDGDALADLRAVLDLAPALSELAPTEGIAEAKTSFDRYGGPRTHDLLLVGNTLGGRAVVGIEGKVEETFGQTLAQYAAAARAKLEKEEPTNALHRLEGLLHALANWPVPSEQDARGRLRYQLFSASAGTIAAAAQHGAQIAIFCVHELRTDDEPTAKQAANAADLDRWIRSLYPSAAVRSGPAGWVAGPFEVVNPTERLPTSVALYVAKVSTVMASQ